MKITKGKLHIHKYCQKPTKSYMFYTLYIIYNKLNNSSQIPLMKHQFSMTTNSISIFDNFSFNYGTENWGFTFLMKDYILLHKS